MFAAISYREELESPYFFDVWGTGASEEAAVEDAGEWAAKLGADLDLEVLEIDYPAAEYVQDVGGDMHVHRCHIVEGIVALREAV